MEEQRIAAKIEALFARARDNEGTTEEEREACLQKAATLMMKYDIEAAKLDLDGKNKSGRKIVHMKLEYLSGEFCWELMEMRANLYRHVRCKVYGRDVAGYEDDIRYADMLWAKVQMDFTSRMRPVWSKTRSFNENVYLLKESGKSWMDIVYAENRAMGPDSTLNSKSGSKLRTAYKTWAKMIGQDSRQVDSRGRVSHAQSPQKWREGFMMSYKTTVSDRLWVMKRQAEAENAPGKEGEIALQHDEDRVNAFFWDLFPDLHPDNIAAKNKQYEEQEKARRAAMTEKERQREDEKLERDRRRYEREFKPRTIDRRGWEAGHSAGQKVDLSANDKVGHNARRLGA